MTDPNKIDALWKSGLVNRWHTHPDPRLRNAQDTAAGHAQRVATLLACLFPDLGRDEALAALWHDAGESVTGDVPWHAKRDAPGIRSPLGRAVDAAEAAALNAMGVVETVLGHGDVPAARLRLCDRLDAYLFVRLVAPDLLREESWEHDYYAIMRLAEKLGVAETVKGLIG